MGWTSQTESITTCLAASHSISLDRSGAKQSKANLDASKPLGDSERRTSIVVVAVCSQPCCTPRKGGWGSPFCTFTRNRRRTNNRRNNRTNTAIPVQDVISFPMCTQTLQQYACMHPPIHPPIHPFTHSQSNDPYRALMRMSAHSVSRTDIAHYQRAFLSTEASSRDGEEKEEEQQQQ